MLRRTWLRVLLAAAFSFGAAIAVHAQGYPSKPVTLVVPLLAQGIDPVAGSPEDLRKLNEAELARWAKAVEQAGAKLSN